ncbi:MAG: hypothetical protein ABIN08_21760 [Caldimonas sp.]
MADKISEALWKAFTKKQKLEGELEDKDLLKALARFDKTDERKPEPRLEALGDLIKEIPKQVTALVKLKKKLGDKPFGAIKDELYAILEEAETLQKKAQAALDADGDADEEDDEPANVLLEPKRLLAMLTRCKRDPDLSMRFAFIDAKDKQGAVFAMHPKMSGKKLFAALQAETGVKTGAFGTARVQVDGEFPGTCLMLQLDKPLSGLVKKVKGPVKAAGFKIAKAVLWNADGTVFEQESEADEPAASGGDAASGTTATGATPGAPDHKALSDAFKERLKAVLALTRETGDAEAAAQAKKLCADAGMHSSNREWAKVDALMTQAEALLRGRTQGTTAATAEPAGGGATGTTRGAPDHKALSDAFKERLKAVLALTRETGDAEAAAQAKKLCADAGMHSSNREWAKVDALMTQAEDLLQGKPRTPPGSTATPAASGAAAAPSQAPAGSVPKAPPLDPAMPFRSRMSGLVPVFKAAEAAGGRLAEQVKAKREEAVALVRQKGFTAEQLAQALALLDEIDASMAAAGIDAKAGGVPKVAAATGANVLFKQSQIVWEQTRNTVQAELRRMEEAIRAAASDEFDSEAIAASTQRLYRTLDGHDERLRDKLDEAVKAVKPEEQQARKDEAQAMIREILAFVDGNPLMQAIDVNPFGSFDIKKRVTATLNDLSAQFA